MNKRDVLKKFKKSINRRTFLNPEKDLAFEIANFDLDVSPKIQKGLTYDITTTKIRTYDKNNGNWFKTRIALYEIV